ncbi:hypothetical protein TNCV_2155261 [Trichonephila clavipes]|nr:hypothetical protein TNCV_2155261 [Trichonephila clavipes]
MFSLLGLWIVRPFLNTLGILGGASTGIIALLEISTLTEEILSVSASNGTSLDSVFLSRLNFQKKNSLVRAEDLGIAASQL